ncbi:MAG: peptide chain release factor N(5)-glutamine methyltransferase [Draconibacterium sp.]
MEIEVLFNKLFNELRDKIHFLEDKPEETIESTLKALWLAASGTPVSAEKAIDTELPALSEIQIKNLNELIRTRLNNIPLAHITKRQNFLGIELITDKRALIPRKETEILGKKALELSLEIASEKNEIKVFDVCCGSGNLGVTVAKLNPKCRVYSSDISDEAIELTKENIDLLNLNNRIEAAQSDMFEAFKTDTYYKNIDLIICNPPYISSAKVVKMDSEIALNEPSLAFDGGMLGIKIIQKLINEAPLFLTNKGWLVFEVGVGQGDFVGKLLEKTKQFQQIGSVSDDAGNVRVVFAQKYFEE